MMHEREKSDPNIVAGKPTNNAGLPAAEPVEPRAGTEGNADEQSTHRTQCRERVSQAFDRVRQAARLRKKEKFTALLHHINIDLLREAFFALRRDAAPGIDGLTWQAYGSVSGTAVTPDVHTEGRWQSAPASGGHIRSKLHFDPVCLWDRLRLLIPFIRSVVRGSSS